MKYFKTIAVILVLVLCGWATVSFAASQGTSSSTAQNIVDQARVYLNNTTTTPWTDAELLQFVNDGMVDIVSKTHCLEATKDIDLVTDTLEYTLSSITYLTVIAVIYNDSDSKEFGLKKGSPGSVGQNTAVTVPTYWYEWAGSVGVYPTFTRTTETITVYYVTRPTAIALSGNVTVPAIYDKALVLYVVAQAWIKDKQHAKYGQFMNQYYQDLGFLKATLNAQPAQVVE